VGSHLSRLVEIWTIGTGYLPAMASEYRPEQPSLDGPRAKLGWAVHHFELLHSAIREWLEPPDQPTIVAETNVAEKRYDLIYCEPRPKPPKWSLMAGDYLNNLRSTLDYVVAQAVIAEGGHPGKNHAFPIALTEDWWLNNVTSRNPKRRPGPLDGITKAGAAWTLIRDAQPYIGRDETAAKATPLATLARLNNTDKHRELNLSTLTMGDTAQIRVANANWRPHGGYLPTIGTAIEPNQKFGWLVIELIDVDHAELQVTLATDVAFDGVGLRDFRPMFEDVKALVVAFEKLLGV
jgi:hypothetical protein